MSDMLAKHNIPAELFEAYQKAHPGITEKTNAEIVKISSEMVHYPFRYAMSDPMPIHSATGELLETIEAHYAEALWEKWQDVRGGRWVLAYAADIDTLFIANVKVERY